MATGVQVFKSSDTSAPQISGTTGALCTVLDAVLVNGYGSTSPAGTAGGGAWTIAFTGTSKRAYRPSAGNRFYLRVQDDGPGAATFQEARVVSYESMTTIDAGTNPMPTVVQAANGLFVRKSAAASATTRPWIVVADDRTVNMYVFSGDIANAYMDWHWGDFYSHLSGDSYRTMLIARSTESSAVALGTDLMQNSTFTNAIAGNYLQRNRSGVVGSIAIQKTNVPGGAASGGSVGNISSIAYPNGEDGGLYMTPLYLNDVSTAPTSSIRGRIRGHYCSMHTPGSFNDGDTFSGVGDYAGKTFMIIKLALSSGLWIVETSDTWDTSS